MLLLDPAFGVRVSQIKEHPQLGSLQRWLVGSQWSLGLGLGLMGLSMGLEGPSSIVIIVKEESPRSQILVGYM